MRAPRVLGADDPGIGKSRFARECVHHLAWEAALKKTASPTLEALEETAAELASDLDSTSPPVDFVKELIRASYSDRNIRLDCEQFLKKDANDVNVVDFGAFVDIGVKHDGLVHVSEMAERFVRDPLTVVAAGQVVQVRVMEVDKQRERVKLSMRGIKKDRK